MRFAALAAATVAAALLVPAQAGDDNPDSMLQALYSKYKGADKWPKGYVPCHEFCSPDFAKIVDAAKLDYDPICQCKGDSALLSTAAGTFNSTPQGFEYDVTVRDLSHPNLVRTWFLCLRVVNGHWRIVDIMERRARVHVSLRERLTGKGL